jgi:hypothetical protein
MSDHKLAAELVMRCFHSRTAAHVLHLKSKSYSEHMALHDFYDEIVDLTDAFAEMYQGEYMTLLNEHPTRWRWSTAWRRGSTRTAKRCVTAHSVSHRLI